MAIIDALLKDYDQAEKAAYLARQERNRADEAIMAQCPWRPGQIIKTARGDTYAIVRMKEWERADKFGVVYIAECAPLTVDGRASKTRHMNRYLNPATTTVIGEAKK